MATSLGIIVQDSLLVFKARQGIILPFGPLTQLYDKVPLLKTSNTLATGHRGINLNKRKSSSLMANFYSFQSWYEELGEETTFVVFLRTGPSMLQHKLTKQDVLRVAILA